MSVTLAAAVFLLFSVILIRRWLPPQYAVPLVAAKFLVLLVNMWFETLFYPYHTRPSDSLTYYQQASQLLEMGHSPVSLLLAGLEPVSALTGSTHPFYWYWNVVWMSVIGENIFAPMVANVFMTVLGSVVATLLVARLGYSYRYQQWFLAFTLVHWEILAWPAMTNLKDPLIATLTVTALFLIVVVYIPNHRLERLLAVAVFGLIILVFGELRFYVPAIIGAAISVWAVIEVVRIERWGYLAYCSVGGLIFLRLLSRRWDLFMSVISIRQFPKGLLQFPLTPTPWDIGVGYTFLRIPSTIHWLLAPITVIGGIWLVMERIERLFVIYALVTTVLFAAVPLQLGPRHRFQIVFIVAWAQFHGLWVLLNRRYNITVDY